MSDLLKIDDKAILSVLLYQFLHGKSAYSSFKEFNKVVKDNFISRDDFKFWFDRFSSGKLDEEDDNLSISDMKKMLSDDKHRLKACIFFEYLKEIDKILIPEFCHEEVFVAYKRMSQVTLLKLHHIESWYFPPIYPFDYHAIYNRFGPIEDGGARDLDIPNTNAYYKIIFGWDKTSMKKRIY
ncbi:Protein CBG27287 [Caenorhabditis briggsae]|uniref:Protein CBG27287 n=1 Tax=Caenorhabditis briggsae TaxID=6238 RepID=B6IE41_CAEBR|nr:Protein CBG27287 [Caenorhabditis briggsae]CAS01105.1 Protein CBG27287 [Caenorhabditis briggsae]